MPRKMITDYGIRPLNTCATNVVYTEANLTDKNATNGERNTLNQPLDLPLTANKVRTFRNLQLCVSFNLRWVHTSGACLNICVMQVDDGR